MKLKSYADAVRLSENPPHATAAKHAGISAKTAQGK